MRVDTPHDVFHAYSKPPAAVWYCTLNAFREVLTEVVGCPGLECLVVLHQRFEGVGAQRARKFLALGLAPGVDYRIAIQFSWNVRYTPSICRASASASASVA